MTVTSGTGNSNRSQRIRTAIIALAAVFLTVSVVWYTQRDTRPPGPKKPKAWEDREAEAVAGGYKILTTDELVERIDMAPRNQLIVDVRQDWEYQTVHIKGAVVYPVETSRWWWFRHTSPLLRLIGSDTDRSIVFY